MSKHAETKVTDDERFIRKVYRQGPPTTYNDIWKNAIHIQGDGNEACEAQ